MLTVYPDIPQHRRKFLHFVLDENEVCQFTAKKMSAVIDWLYENGHSEFQVKTEDNRFTMVLVRNAA